MKYPIVTKANFEDMTSQFAYKKGYDVRLLKVRKPRTRQEFYELTKAMYGVGLGVTGHTNGHSGSYRIEANQIVYAHLDIPSLWDKKYSQYVGLKFFLDTCFGPLTCGGVAGTHYGQFKCGHRDGLRLKKFFESEFVPSDPLAMG